MGGTMRLHTWLEAVVAFVTPKPPALALADNFMSDRSASWALGYFTGPDQLLSDDPEMLFQIALIAAMHC
jgi:hypothetical protein